MKAARQTEHKNNTERREHQVLGFGKITWRRVPEEQEIAENEVVVQFRQGADLILLGNTLTNLKATVDERRSINPSASVCYHEIDAEAADPKEPG